MVWEKVLDSDLMSPNTRALSRVSDKRAVQFWDKHRALSHRLGEGRDGPVWDWAAIYGSNAAWTDSPPKPLFSGRTVVSVVSEFDRRLGDVLNHTAAAAQ